MMGPILVVLLKVHLISVERWGSDCPLPFSLIISEHSTLSDGEGGSMAK